MVKMLEPVLIVKVKKDDSSFVKKFFNDLEKEYTNLMKTQTGEDYKTTLQLDQEPLDSDW